MSAETPSGPTPPPGRLTTAQAVGWAIVFLIVLALIAAFFAYDAAARPLLGSVLPGGAASWPAS